MNPFPEKKEVLEKVQKGILNARENFSLWTGEELYLSYAPANFLSIHISQEISKLSVLPEIFIDATIADTLKYALKNTDEYKSFMRKNEIMDRTFCITLDERFDHETNRDSIAKVIISVRNGVRNVKEEYLNDIDVMCKVISDSSLDYAVFAFYLDISNKARIKAKERINELISAFDEVSEKYKEISTRFIGGDINTIENIGEWSVGCYVIENK
ncbi:hypothetical protein LPB137_02225 [Poseidonibacter parvus]|uniref:Uncharacterized protein n=1 Tax=Poseidonibacter parvus TaxID=1850254 RepID=A0A1P8KJK3_9BACT|nr:hypothetical protein [Poseidonibacter parvus]APW64743.1 hypothetical protein LPB137_02225 [Poseidonibacter parvus]